MDIQVCGDNELIAAYLTKYCTKDEPAAIAKELRDAMRRIREDDSPIAVKLVKQAMKIKD